MESRDVEDRKHGVPLKQLESRHDHPFRRLVHQDHGEAQPRPTQGTDG
jgi:hypothetical protein